MEAIFKQAKEEQEKADLAFEEEEKGGGGLDSKMTADSSIAPTDNKVVPQKRGRQSKKASDLLAVDALRGADDKSLIPGSTIEVLSGAFAGYSGILKKVDSKAGLVCPRTLSLCYLGGWESGKGNHCHKNVAAKKRRKIELVTAYVFNCS